MKLFNCKLLINLELMLDIFFKIRRLFIILLALFSHDLIARSWRVSQIPNGSVNGCRTCHNSSYRSLNSFGLDVRSVVGRGSTATFWTSILASKDSDGDGASNGQELGDVDGDGVSTIPRSDVTNPGDSNSKPKKIDTDPPLITINGDSELTLEAGANYTELGAKATDNEDGDLSGSILVTGEVNTKIPGVYKIFYGLKDSAGNEAVTITRTVFVVDTTSPVITLVGEAIVTVEVGSVYKEPGVAANDSVDGDLTSQIKVTGKVHVNKVGEYLIKYSVVDAAGNSSAELTRRIIVGDLIIDPIRIKIYNTNPFSFEFNSLKEKSYAIEFSTDLKEWKEINVIKGTGAIVRFEDERDEVFSQVYFRVRIIE